MNENRYNSATRWKWILGTVAAVFLGGVFLLATVGKVVAPGEFVAQIHLEGLDFLLSAGIVAVIALALEAGLGLALLLGVRHWLVVLPTGLLVAFFLFLTGRNYWLVSQGLRDAEESCGCFGSLVVRTPSEAFWQDLILLVPPMILLVWSILKIRVPVPVVRLGVSLVVALAVGGYTFMSPQLEFSQIATDLASLETDRGFRETEAFQLNIDGEVSEEAAVYQSDGSPEMLISCAELPDPILLDPRTRQFHLLGDGWGARDADGVFFLSSEPEYKESGDFSIEAGGISFQLADKQFLIESRP
jgi:uncharacterized membrane protein YphA (DoxX/SURF4 family)